MEHFGEGLHIDMGELGKSRTRPAKLKFSTCVDSIKDNIKRISGIHTYKGKRGVVGDSPFKVPEEQFVDVCNTSEQSSSRRRKSSFEMYLSTIPKLDPVDRTVGWVMMQPDIVSCSSYEIQDPSNHARYLCSTVHEIIY